MKIKHQKCRGENGGGKPKRMYVCDCIELEAYISRK